MPFSHRDKPGWEFSPLLADDEFPPLSARVQVEFGARTRGARPEQPAADHFLILRLGRHQETLLTSLPPSDAPAPFNEFGYGMVVADGGGEAASRRAISALVHLALHYGKWNVRINAAIANDMMERVERFYRQVDLVVGAQNDIDGAEMHTSLTCLYTAGSDCFFAHVGHSRAYLLRQGRLVQMTRDHTVEADVLAGDPPAVPTSAHDLQHVLVDVIGGPPGSLRVDVEHISLADRDVLLLCTNGLTDVVSDQAIQAVLEQQAAPDEHCQELIDRVTAAGAVDDTTVIVAHYRIPT